MKSAYRQRGLAAAVLAMLSMGCGTRPIPAPSFTCPMDAGSNIGPPSVSSAVAKVKDLLVALPPTEAEVQAVTRDPSALEGLVGQWMTLPQYSDKMRTFFEVQFQQDKWDFSNLSFQYISVDPFGNNAAQMTQNFQESFARTALELIAEGQPFTSTMTTTRFMMTPALMEAYAMQDTLQVDDDYTTTDYFPLEHPTSMTIESSTPIPISNSLDPTGPSFLTFFDPSVASSSTSGCPSGTVSYASPISRDDLAFYLTTGLPWRQIGMSGCSPNPAPAADQPFQDSDFNTWQMVTIRPPAPGESTTPIYDLAAMRAGADLVLRVPRVGFFTTTAFAARFPTNPSNLARVLMNQTLIVALGEPVDLTNTTAPPSLAALDQAHAAPGTVCYGCHQSLDPMRQFFRQAYSLYLGGQTRPVETALPGQFAFHGVSASGTGIFDLGALLASHPMFATAWVQKLCTYATSAHCDETDPEFLRLVGVFTNSGFSWNALVQALFSSPLISYLQPTNPSGTTVETFSIARQEHLCALLSSRLGTPDVCGLQAGTVPLSTVTQSVAATWPSDQYSRGSATAALVVNPSLFLRGGLETLCADLADHFVDSGPSSAFQSAHPSVAIAALVTNLMGLTSDRSATPLSILQYHFDTAIRAKASASDALKSTFTLACLSPFVAGVGQ